MIAIGVLTISDRGFTGERRDEAGPVVEECLSRLGGRILKREIVPDEKPIISAKLKEWADTEGIDLVVTTGGTGLSPRDVTPEATLAVVDRLVPGMPEAMRMETLKKTCHAMISRGVAGIRGKCLIVNLPGSVKAVRECLEVILPVLPHALMVLGGEVSDCGRVHAN